MYVDGNTCTKVYVERVELMIFFSGTVVRQTVKHGSLNVGTMTIHLTYRHTLNCFVQKW
jgi:hypothetical protein